MDKPQNEDSSRNRLNKTDSDKEQDFSAVENKSLTETLSSVTDLRNQLSKMVQPAVEAMRRIMNDTDYLSGLYETLNSFSRKIVELYTFDFSPLTESMRDFGRRLSEIIKNIQIPEISEEQKQELLDSYRKWGEYGWTINPCADFETLFDTVPNTKKEADFVAMKYCNKKYIASIFGEIRRCNRVKKSDFEEAVFLFESSKYKSCALILFSLIDSHLIRLQRKSDFNKMQRRREVGARAVEIVKARAEGNSSEIMLFTAMFYSNLFACLTKLFENGKDFKEQPQVINRNFLNHGMLTRRVTRKDCIQLFLLYYNMLCLLEMVY